MLKTIINFSKQLLFGVRIKGEKLTKPSFKTTLPDNQPPQFDWFKEFRVSSLYRVTL
ncbi:MAG: hypothetical protein JSU03_05045 [Bacteroidetes bacterium]|nr:hypothetical protein [Bacteroidota bacterium]